VLAEDGAEFNSSADQFAASETGLRLNNGGRVHLAGSAIKDHSFAGLHLAGSEAKAEKCVFSGNSMAVFADCQAKAKFGSCDFSGNRTGVKADARSAVSAENTGFSGSEWDALWCAGDASLDLRDCVFRDNRYGIKEDGPSRVQTSGLRFEGKHQSEHLRYPR